MTTTAFPAPDVTGYVLAGGRSSRMGQDKALLHFQGAPLVAHALHQLRPVCAAVAILSGPRDAARETLLAPYSRLVPDPSPEPEHEPGHSGPLAALAAALADCTTPYALLLPVDQPAMGGELLKTLIAGGVPTGAGAACFLHRDRPEPLPLLVARSLGPPLLQALRSGERRLLPTVQACASRLQRPLQFVPAPPSAGPDPFLNLNTPADLRLWHLSNHSAAAASETSDG